MADQLCTTAQVKARLGITDATDDVLIGELIDEVSEYIQERTGRKLVPEAGVTYIVDTTAGSVINVRRGIRTVTTLSVAAADSPDDGSGTYVAVAAADILLRPSSIGRKPGWPATRILLRGAASRLVDALNGAKIVGDWGFAATPLEITAVAIDAVVAAYTARQNGASEVIGADGNAISPWADFFSDGTAQARTIARYRGSTLGIG